MCPDIPKDDGLILQGYSSSWISKNFSFTIKKCLNKPYCKSEEVIDEWIKDANQYCQQKPNIMIIGTKSDLCNLKIIDELKQKAKADYYSKLFFKF